MMNRGIAPTEGEGQDGRTMKGRIPRMAGKKPNS
jgi:hypothetical protein